MTSTPFVTASFAGQTSGALLSSYVPQSGDVNAVFTKLHGASNLAFGSANDVNNTVGGSDAFYGAGGVLSSGQTQMDQQVDIKVSSTDYVATAGMVYGDDGTGSNYFEVRLDSGTVFSPGFVRAYNVVNGNGSNSSIASSGISVTAGTTYTLQTQIRGTPGSYTISAFFGPKGGTLAQVITNVAVPSLVMPGRSMGVHQVYYLNSSSTAAQTDAQGAHLLNYASSAYAPSLTAGTVSVTGTGAGAATVSTTAATLGTAPYSYQFQKAPVTNGTVGTYANLGTAGTSLTVTDTESVGTTESYRVVVTDSASTPGTSTSTAVSYGFPNPSYALSTSPTSLSLTQGTSSTLTVTSAGTGGYSATPALTVSGLPSGVAGSFSAPSISGGSGSSTLTLTAAGNAVTGTSTITVTGTDGNGLVETVTAALTVTASVGGATLDTVNNNVLALISAMNAAVNRNTFS
jgi:hypothetical protein